MSKNHLVFAFLTILDQYRNFNFCKKKNLQNGWRRPFWMSQNHFRSHFWPFQINRKLFLNFCKMAAGAHFGCPKFTFNRISGHFRSIRNFNFFFEIFIFVIFFFTKWLPAAILDVENNFRSHFWPFQINTKKILNLFLQNGCSRLFWMSEIHFGSHFWAFQINTDFFVFKFLQNGCRWPFWMSENHFRSHFWPFQIDF